MAQVLTVVGSDLVLSGHLTYSIETYIDVTSLTVEDGTSIRVNNGTSLVIIAEKAVFGSGVTIDAAGVEGASGSNGHSPGPPDPWISSGSNDDVAHAKWQEAVSANKNGTNGHIDEGTPGGNGGFGTSGGLIKLFMNVATCAVSPLVRLTALSGAGGRGGHGGPGRWLKCGGHGSHVYQALSGPNGADGRPDANGRLEVYVTGGQGGTFLTAANQVATPQLAVAVQLDSTDFAKAVAKERALHPHIYQ